MKRRNFLKSAAVLPIFVPLLAAEEKQEVEQEPDFRIVALQRRISLIEMTDAQISQCRMHVLVRTFDPIAETWVALHGSPEVTRHDSTHLEFRWKTLYGENPIGYALALKVMRDGKILAEQRNAGPYAYLTVDDEVWYTYNFNIEGNDIMSSKESIQL